MSAPPQDPPPLSLEVLTDPKEKREALKLVVDSVAQQRQIASRALVFHPLCLAVFAAVLSSAHYLTGIGNDFSAMLITYPAIILSYLVAIRYFTSAYIRIAEDTDWLGWLRNEDGVEDTVIGARYGEEVIAAVVLRFEGRSRRKDGDGSAFIRAWTTRTRYRNKGLGGDMLREAVKVAKEARGRSYDIKFADDHANSNLALHSMFNEAFRSRQTRAEKALAAAIKDWGDGKLGAQ
ncbi:hypothetical protein ACJ41O_014796 [Fusarium nematophilum]